MEILSRQRRRATVPRTSRAVIESLEARHLLSANVLQYHNDSFNTGANLNETVLTPANVSAATFGEVASTAVDGQVDAQPLYVENVNISVGPRQGQHNVVFVATEHDSVYAIDSASGAVLWQTSFLHPAQGVTTVPAADTLSDAIAPELGVTATPVIDPSTNTLYVLADTKESRGDGAHYVYRLHALDLSSGAEKFGGPVLLGDTLDTSGKLTYVSGPSVNGTGADSVDGKVSFNALQALGQAALTLADGNVFLAFGTHADASGHGWVMSVNAHTLGINGVLCTTPNGSGGGIWQGGAAIAQAKGALYAVTGNGAFDTTLNAAGFPAQGDYGESIIKFSYDPSTSPTNQNANGWGLKIDDYFTPANHQDLNARGLDLGSGGVLLLPPGSGTAAHPDLLVQGDEEGTVYLMDRDNLPALGLAPAQLLQQLPNEISSSYGLPADYQGTLYYAGAGDALEAFAPSGGTLGTTASSRSNDTFALPGATPSVSANGAINGIVWAVDTGTNQLRAYDAANLSHELFSGPIGTAGRFTTPTIADGQIYVGTADSLVVFGLKKPSGGLTPTQQFVEAAFEQVLGRAAEPEALAYWSGQLNQGLARLSFALELTHSTEYYRLVVEAAYHDFLGRAADTAGLAQWSDALAAGLTDEQLQAAFVASPEFAAQHGTSDRDWVDAMYQAMLGRAADASGETYWTEQLAQGATRAQVALRFAASAEREAQIIRDDYSYYLGRAAGESEVASWVAAFQQGVTNENVVAGFVASDEYGRLHAP